MIAQTPRPFIFVHIPKCAGTSIEKAFLPIISDHINFNTMTEGDRCRFWLPGRYGLQHCKLRRYESHFKLDQFFKFAFVRNPWDRAISQIEYLRSNVRNSPFLGKTIKDQLNVYCNLRKNIWAHDLGASQLDYLRDQSGSVRMDFIGRFECLENDFRVVCEMLGIKPTLKLPHILKSERKLHYSAYYDGESAAWVRIRFAKDIQYFGYVFADSPNSLEIASQSPASTPAYGQRNANA
jgi:chondroitin 4-sulfotransferase 11